MTEGDTDAKPVVIIDEAEADKLNQQANKLFTSGKYDKALDVYTSAIENNPNIAKYFGNRSTCNIKLECYGSALQDANEAIRLDPKYVKGYYRRASANMALQKFKLSMRDYEAVLKACPNDKDAKKKFTECKKIVHQRAFAKAIAVDDSKSVVESLDLDSITIEPDYDGPQLEDGKVTVEFMEALLPYLKNQKKLHKRYAYEMLVSIKEQFAALPSLVDVTIPEGEKLTVCGDIHGQFYDLLNIFEINGVPSETNPYLFNGDFVDRGSFSVEVILTLFGFKLLYPNHMFLSRGNHETVNMNQMYGFEGEVKEKYTPKMVDLFTEVYNLLPLSHLINSKILTMHGGLFSKDDITLDDIRKTERNKQPPDSGIMCDILWSDPQPQNGRSPSKRGVGVAFGPDVTRNFCKLNDLKFIIRSHEVKPEGYEVAHDGQCITVFSAPNYCDQMGNKGAFITLSTDLIPKYTSYEAVPHPTVKPMAYANSMMSMFGLM